MKLLIDIGNTRVKWALGRAGVLIETAAAARDQPKGWTARLPDKPVDAVWASCVAGAEAARQLERWAGARNIALYWVTSGARWASLVNGYTDPTRLGADRWLACIAASTRGAGSVLVADAGTALTLDYVDATGQHGGGLITPGVTTGRAALCDTTQLPPPGDTAALEGMAHDTVEAIVAGTWQSAIALLDRTAHRLAPARLLLTGGEAGLLAAHLTRGWTLAPHLVLEGLARYAEQPAEGSHGAS